MNDSTLGSVRRSDLYVVGVGASAGGLDALSKFLKNFNGISADICIVIVMHLSPDYKSQLAPILDKRCKWPVISAENNMPLSNGNIYVTPQNKQIRIHNCSLVLEDLSPELSFTPSIDNFFLSLAKDRGKKSIGIILSGFGKDGAKGMTSIRELGGFTIAQLPETAEHRDMPHAAIDTGHIDLIVPAEQMYDDIVQYITNSRAIASSADNKSSVDAIFELLEKRSGTDFSMYKPTTIMRRINHRIASLQLTSIMQYYELIKENPRELDNLFDAVLIGVTEFFRDVEAFDNLRDQLNEYLQDKEPGDSIRIWSVGCATGEEPYSLAILVYELLGKQVNQYQIQIFASDIDERAINFGRKAIYHKDILGNIPSEIINKYFEKQDDLHYEVKKEIKQHVLFTRHDITNDPPFVKLDLVVCRNLLIYFNNNLQKQSFQIFHYALKRKGLLFLGKSESVSVAADLFSKIGKGKIYRKADSSLNYQLKFSRFRTKNKEIKEEQRKSNIRNMSIVDVAKETLYYKYDNPFVIINETAEIKEVHGSLRLYLEISEGTMNVNIHKMVNPELVTVVKAVHAQVKKTGVTHTSHVVKFKLYDQLHYVRIKIIPLVYRISEVQYYMLIFEKIEPSEGHLELQKKLETSDFVNLRIKELEDELASTKEHLQIFTEELEATNEELQTINEELQSSNEELKSSNEELETSNEELQSANEELNTANQELRLTNDLLIDKEKELKDEKEESERNRMIYRTILDNTPNGTVTILNEDFVAEFTGGKWYELHDMNPNDLIGKNQVEMNPSSSQREQLIETFNKALEGKPSSTEVEYKGNFFSIQAVPFKYTGEDSKKILFLSQDITESKKDDIKYKMSLEAAKIMVVEFDFEKKEMVSNANFSNFIELDESKPVTLENLKSLLLPEDKKDIFESVKKGIKKGYCQEEFRIKVKGDIKWVRVFCNAILDDKNKPVTAIAALLDITEDRRLLEKIKNSEEHFRKVADDAPMTVWLTDKNGGCTYINKSWLKYTGSQIEDSMADNWVNFLHEDDKERCYTIYMDAFKERKPYTLEYRIQGKDGNYKWFLSYGIPRFDDEGNFLGYLGSNSNIESLKEIAKDLENMVESRTTEITAANKELVKLNMNLEEFAYVASHDLKEPLRKIRTFNSLISTASEKEEIENYSKRIEISANRLTKLIDSILEYSRLEKSPNKTETIKLNSCLDEVLSDLSILVDENNVEVKNGELGEIKGVPIRIYQLFSNLVRNAIKFNNNEPKIEISKEEVLGKDMDERFGSGSEQRFVMISFKDNGIGMDLVKKDYIFKPFKKLNSSSDYPGTGIGLAICKRIMDLHKGFIDVESKLDQGSEFKLYFPLK